MNLRNLLFQIHLWVGLSLGLLFAVLGLTGTGMMFRTMPGIGQKVPEVRSTAGGEILPLERIAAAAKASTEVPRGAATTILLPRQAGMPAQVRFVRPAAAGRGAAPAMRAPIIPDVLVDPVNGRVLGNFTPGMTPFMQLIHDLHGSLLIGGGTGRLLVGWLGVGMMFLGLSGLYLWWPRLNQWRGGQWKNAFLVRRKAKGLRLHRELHGAAGIWGLAVFLIVSFTGVAIVFPQTVRAGFAVVAEGGDRAPVPAQRGNVRAPTVEAGGIAITANEAMALALRANPGEPVQSVTLPARPNQAIIVTVGEGRGTPVFVDPYKGAVMRADGPAPSALDKVVATLRPLHEGGLLGPVYWLLVLLSGLLPALFVVTGLMMWLKKRENRMAMNRPLAGVPAE